MSIYALFALVLFCLFIFAICTGDGVTIVAVFLLFLVLCFIAGESMAATTSVLKPVNGTHSTFEIINTPSSIVTCTPLPTKWRCITRDGYVFSVHKTAAELKVKF